MSHIAISVPSLLSFAFVFVILCHIRRSTFPVGAIHALLTAMSVSSFKNTFSLPCCLEYCVAFLPYCIDAFVIVTRIVTLVAAPSQLGPIIALLLLSVSSSF